MSFQEHKTLALRKDGIGVVLDSELPYLLALHDDILSTGMRLYHLQVGHALCLYHVKFRRGCPLIVYTILHYRKFYITVGHSLKRCVFLSSGWPK